MASVPCYSPTNVRFTFNLGVLTIEWDGTAPSYRLKRRTGNGPETNMGDVFTNSVEVADLVVGTQYGFYITSLCSDKESIPRYASYVIPSDEAGATNLAFAEENLTSVKLTWDGPAGLYGVLWGTEEYLRVDDNSNTALITGLDASQNYTFRVDRYVGDYRIASVESIDKKAFCCATVTT